MNIIVTSLVVALQSVITFIVVYRAAISLAGYLRKEESRISESPRTRFAIIVPAHDEELSVSGTVSSILESNYPSELRQVYVIADNCSDRTAKIALRSGAVVLERDDPRLGKGYALQWALERIRQESYDAYVVIDADSTVSPPFLSHLDQDIQNGERIIQGNDVTRNKDASWMTRLSDMSDVLQFQLYFRGRSRLGLSCRLLGNGMCFSKEVIARLGWNAFSITENWEYYMKVILAGYHLHYNPRAVFFSERAVDFRQGKAQRLRWMAGRAEITRKFVPILIMNGIRNKEAKMLDVAIDFLLPSQSMLLAMIFLPLVVTFLMGEDGLFFWMLGIIAVEAGYIGMGAWHGTWDGRTFGALLLAPFFILWKVYVRGKALFTWERTWVKTKRGTVR